MNFDWILNPLTIYSVLAIGGLAIICLAAAIKVEIRTEQKRHAQERLTLEQSVSALQKNVEELLIDARERAATAATHALTSGLNVHKRAEAMRMYRRGCDTHTVCATLGLPQAEVALLQKVHHIISSPSERLVAN